MKDRVGFLAGCAAGLTELCIYYAVARLLIMARQGWGLALGWILLCTALCAAVFALFLRKTRGLGLLAAVTGAMFAAVLAVFLLVSRRPLTFGYVFVVAVGAGMAVGCPLHHTLNRPVIHKHLARLDGLILLLAVLLLCREALDIGRGVIALATAVLLLDAAAAVGLRMTEGGTEDAQNAFRASLVALGGAAGLALIIGLLVAVFSRSGEVIGAALRAAGSGLRAVGAVLESFFRWLSGLVRVEDNYGALPLEDPGARTTLTVTEAMTERTLDPRILAAICGAILLAAVILLLLYMRKRAFTRSLGAVSPSEAAVIRRRSGGPGELWARLKGALAFRWRAFCRRNTPGGLLIYTERAAKRKKKPRRPGESMRRFLARMDAPGGLAALADALDREYYGDGRRTMSARSCRQTRHYIRKVIRHG